MAGIAEKVVLFNQSYKLVLVQLAKEPLVGEPDLARRLAQSINLQIKAGETDPVVIAASAIRSIAKG